MTSREYCYWLQGYFEISGVKELSKRQTEIVIRHLSLVFKHEIDPSYGTSEHQQTLLDAHSDMTALLKC